MSNAVQQTEFPAPALLRWCGIACGTLAGWVILSGTHIRTGWMTSSWPSPRIPFGTQGVVWVHLLAALPVAWWLSQFLVPDANGQGRPAVGTRRLYAFVGLLVAGILGWLTIQQGDAIGGWSAARTYAESHTLRTCWALLWQLANCFIVRGIMPASGRSGMELVPAVRFFSPSGIALFLSLSFAAWMLPKVYVDDLVVRHTQIAVQQLRQHQYRLAWGQVQQLVDLASPHVIGTDSPTKVRADLERLLNEFLITARRQLAPNADEAQIIQHAQTLQQLGFWEEAVALLTPLAERMPVAGLQLVKLEEEKEDLAKSVEWCELVWTRLAGDTSAEGVRVREELIVKWAHNLRRLGRAKDAEQCLLAARTSLPSDNGLIDYELGYHYKEAGFHQLARRHLARAAELDRRFERRAIEELELIDREMSFCMPAIR